jgi:hypothetical protein
LQICDGIDVNSRGCISNDSFPDLWFIWGARENEMITVDDVLGNIREEHEGTVQVTYWRD